MPIGEMEIGEGNEIVFSPLTSCLTAICVLKEGQLVGAHFVHDKRDQAAGLIDKLKAQVGSREVTGVYLVGVTGAWMEGKVTYSTILESLNAKLNTGCIDSKSTSGESETVSAKIKDGSDITVTATYPQSAKEKRWAGAHDLTRTPPDVL